MLNYRSKSLYNRTLKNTQKIQMIKSYINTYAQISEQNLSETNSQRVLPKQININRLLNLYGFIVPDISPNNPKINDWDIIYLCVNTIIDEPGHFTCRQFDTKIQALLFYNIKYEIRRSNDGWVKAWKIISISSKYPYRLHNQILKDKLKEAINIEKISIMINTD